MQTPAAYPKLEESLIFLQPKPPWKESPSKWLVVPCHCNVVSCTGGSKMFYLKRENIARVKLTAKRFSIRTNVCVSQCHNFQHCLCAFTLHRLSLCAEAVGFLNDSFPPLRKLRLSDQALVVLGCLKKFFVPFFLSWLWPHLCYRSALMPSPPHGKLAMFQLTSFNW